MLSERLLQIHVLRLVFAPLGNNGSSSVCKFVVLCALLGLGLRGALAQEPATSFDQLNLLLGKGDKVTLVDSSGNKATGRIDRLGPEGLDLKVGSKLQSFPEKNVRQITRQKPDSPLNGFAIGAAAGFFATLPINLSFADNEGDGKGLAVAVSAIWGLVGGGIGALVDASIHEKQVVYIRPRNSVSWSISPYSESPFRLQLPGAQTFLTDLPLQAGGNYSKALRLTLRF